MLPHFKIYPVSSDFVSFAFLKIIINLLLLLLFFYASIHLYYRCKYVASSFEATPEAPFARAIVKYYIILPLDVSICPHLEKSSESLVSKNP